MSKQNVEAIYPLSPVQQGILYHSLYEPESSTYFQQLTFTLRGRLDLDAYRQAWADVVARHPILRTLFVWQRRQQPLQVVRSQITLPWEIRDWRQIPVYRQQPMVDNFLETDRERGIDLNRAPLMRLTLLRLTDELAIFVWSSHHLLLDGWSTSRLMEEVFTLYRGYVSGNPPSLPPVRPFRDYIVWLQEQNVAEARQFWTEKLAGFTTPTTLNVGGARETDPGDRHGYVTQHGKEQLNLAPALVQKLSRQARRQALTLNSLLQGAWSLLLSRYSGRQDILFGTTVSTRPPDLPGVEQIAGLFINTLPVPVSVDPERKLIPWLQDLQSRQLAARQYEFAPLVEIQACSSIPHDLPFFETILVFENYPLEPQTWLDGSTLSVEELHFFESTHYPLSLAVMPATGGGLLLHADYDTTRFPAPTIRRLLHHLRTLLEGMLAAMSTGRAHSLASLPLLPASEREQLLVEWNQQASLDWSAMPVHALFEAQVTRTPAATALCYPRQDMRLTYAALNALADALAGHLQALGVGPEVRVGLCAEPSPHLLVGILAILKAGGVYVPLDPSYPQERLAFMLADGRVTYLLTEEILAGRLPAYDGTLVYVDRPLPEPADFSSPALQPTHAAYVIYTSGSTGRPKGVVVPHGPAANHFLAMERVYELAASDRTLLFASPNFDASLEQIFPTLAAGGTVVIMGKEIWPPDNFFERVHALGLTVVDLPTAYWHQLVRTALGPTLAANGQLRLIIVGSEKISAQSVHHWQEASPAHVRLVNAYGPTETVITATVYDVPATPSAATREEVPIGRPVPGRKLYVLDDRRRPVPAGIAGELYIGGPLLARGYLNRPALTADRFLPDPFNGEGARIYRTGDLVRYRPDGQLDFLGRTDDQVKVRGFRIELGEVQSALARHPSVGQATIVTQGDAHGGNQIVAYWVPRTDPAPTSQALQNFLATILPAYMIPAAFISLDTLPLTPGGKIDKGALPSTEFADSQDVVVPRDRLELQLVHLWQEILSVPTIGVTDNFFDLGGHSLLALRLMAQIQKQFEQDLPLSTLLQHPTVEQLATLLREQTRVVPLSPLVPIQPSGSRPPFFCVHPAGGNVLAYVFLARHLGREQPFYGLQAIGFHGNREPYHSIRAMADVYIHALRSRFPSGPYYLGGWSMGGVVAFEMARQLREHGAEVALLALLDTLAPTGEPGAVSAPSPPDNKLAHLAEFVDDLTQGTPINLALPAAPGTDGTVEEHLDAVLAEARQKSLLPPDTTTRQLRHLYHVFTTNIEAVRRYQAGSYAGALALFRAEATPGPRALGWEQFVTGKISVRQVPGTHYTMLTVPHVQKLARQLHAALTRPTDLDQG